MGELVADGPVVHEGVRVRGAVAAAGAAALAAAAAVAIVSSGAPAPSGAAPGVTAQQAYGQLPLRFEANRGQTDSRVDFISRGAGYALFLTPRESVLSLSTPVSTGSNPANARRAVVRMRLSGANAQPSVSGAQPLPGRTNYLRGDDPRKWHTGVPGFGQVRYAGVYPGIDLLYHGRQGKLEYDFVVAPHADPDRIAARFSGARSVALDRSGNLVLRTGAGTVVQEKPVAYQTIAGSRRAVSARFALSDGNRVAFELGAYDRARPLVIDPTVVFSTYLGGGRLAQDSGEGIAADSAGNTYVVGVAGSADFPTTPGALRTSPASGFMTKISPDGSALVFSTYIDHVGLAVAVGPDGAPYIAGGGRVTKLNASGSALVYSNQLGGIPTAIAVDGAGAAYVAGRADNDAFPTTPGALQTTFAGGGDAFVSKLSPNGATFQYSTFLGGAAGEEATGIDLGSDGSAYVSGQTSSTGFPTTAGAYDTACATVCGFVAKLNPAGSALAYSTVLEATSGGYASAWDVAVGTGADAGKAYVFGTHNGTFPITPGALNVPADDGPGGGTFVAKLNAAGTAVDYAAQPAASGEAPDHGASTGFGGIDIDSTGNAIVAGRGFAPVVRPVTEMMGGGFVARLSSDGTALTWSTPLAAPFTFARDVAVDASDRVYVTGFTNNTDFPTKNALQTALGGSGDFFQIRDAFVTKLAPDDLSAPLVTDVSQKGDDAAGGRLVKVTGTGFADAGSVQFGGVPAPRFDVISSTELTAVVPPHAEAETWITVTRNGRTSPPNPIARFVYAEGRWSSIDPSPSGGQVMQLPDGRVLSLSSDAAALYDPASNAWTGAAAPANSGTPTLLASGRVLIAGSGAASVYDPVTGQSTPTSNALTVSGTHTRLADGRVLIVGATTAALYSPATNSFAATGAPISTRGGHTATLLANGRVLVVGGGSGGFTESAELYDPAIGMFTPTDSPNIRRAQGHTATLLADGRVLIAGGRNPDFQTLDSAELYDPATGFFFGTGRMTRVRQEHSATLLPNGKVLIAGGADGGRDAGPPDRADLYDPALGGGSGAFKSAGRTNAGLGGNSAAVVTGDAATCGSGCGKVLVVGGATELYTPRNAPPGSPPPGGGQQPETPQPVPAPGGVDAPPPGPVTGASRDTVRPAVSGVSVLNREFSIGSLLPVLARPARVGTTIRFRLSEPATARLSFARAQSGRRVGSSCRRPTRALRSRRRCTRYVTVTPAVTVRGARTGSNSVRFQGRLSRTRRLRPGRYRLTVTATDAAGNRSRPRTARFRLLPAPRRSR